jgi:hypothetical protein
MIAVHGSKADNWEVTMVKVEYSGKYNQWFEKIFYNIEAAQDFMYRQISKGWDAEMIMI